VIATFVAAISGSAASAQVPSALEVRQLVTFSFLPGTSEEALTAYRDQALPLYRDDTNMLSFRAFREVESPVALDLIVVRAFRGMEGMDASNAGLRDLASAAGTTMGALYGRIAALSSQHTDQFVEMLPALGADDPAAHRLSAFVWYRVRAGTLEEFERALARTVVAWETDSGIAASTGRFLVSDGWHYLRIVGFDSLGAYQEYWTALQALPGYDAIEGFTQARRQVIVASIPALAVR